MKNIKNRDTPNKSQENQDKLRKAQLLNVIQKLLGSQKEFRKDIERHKLELQRNEFEKEKDEEDSSSQSQSDNELDEGSQAQVIIQNNINSQQSLNHDEQKCIPDSKNENKYDEILKQAKEEFLQIKKEKKVKVKFNELKQSQILKPSASLFQYQSSRQIYRDQSQAQQLEDQLLNKALNNLAKQEFNQSAKKQPVFNSHIQFNEFEDSSFLNLLQKFHLDYRLDFDKNLAMYLQVQTQKNFNIITDIDTFDSILPPAQVKNYQYYQNQIISQVALNMIIQERIKVIEKELVDLTVKFRQKLQQATQFQPINVDQLREDQTKTSVQNDGQLLNPQFQMHQQNTVNNSSDFTASSSTFELQTQQNQQNNNQPSALDQLRQTFQNHTSTTGNPLQSQRQTPAYLLSQVIPACKMIQNDLESYVQILRDPTNQVQLDPKTSFTCRSYLLTAIFYDLFLLFEPHQILKSIDEIMQLQQIVNFYCPCGSAVSEETHLMIHLRIKHKDTQRIFISLKKLLSVNTSNLLNNTSGFNDLQIEPKFKSFIEQFEQMEERESGQKDRIRRLIEIKKKYFKNTLACKENSLNSNLTKKRGTHQNLNYQELYVKNEEAVPNANQNRDEEAQYVNQQQQTIMKFSHSFNNSLLSINPNNVSHQLPYKRIKIENSFDLLQNTAINQFEADQNMIEQTIQCKQEPNLDLISIQPKDKKINNSSNNTGRSIDTKKKRKYNRKRQIIKPSIKYCLIRKSFQTNMLNYVKLNNWISFQQQQKTTDLQQVGSQQDLDINDSANASQNTSSENNSRHDTTNDLTTLSVISDKELEEQQAFNDSLEQQMLQSKQQQEHNRIKANLGSEINNSIVCSDLLNQQLNSMILHQQMPQKNGCDSSYKKYGLLKVEQGMMGQREIDLDIDEDIVFK